MASSRWSKIPDLQSRVYPLLLIGATLALGLFLTLPVMAIFWRTGLIGLALPLTRPVAVQALRLSLITTLATTAVSILIGTPVAYLLARYRFPGHAALETLVDLPLVMPPAVAGIALLMAFGRRGLLGAPLSALGVEVAFTPVAVIMAQTFVAAPFYVRSATAGFAGVDHRLEQISATLGVSEWRTFWRVTLPLARPSLLAGAIMTWTRALGEFGATILFAGNFMGRTQTLSLAIYVAFQTDLSAALAMAGVLVILSFGLLVTLRVVTGRRPSGA